MNSHRVLTVLQSEKDRMCLAGVYAHEETETDKQELYQKGEGGWGDGVREGSDVNELCETALNSCLFVLIISLCGIVVFICVCSLARTGC